MRREERDTNERLSILGQGGWKSFESGDLRFLSEGGRETNRGGRRV